jgi:hypothetical protein
LLGLAASCCTQRARKGQRSFKPEPQDDRLDDSKSAALCRKHRLGLRFVFVIDHVSFWQHAFMQNAGHENASRLTPEEYDVLAVFHAAQAGANVVRRPASSWILGQQLATDFKLVKVANGLRRAPST